MAMISNDLNDFSMISNDLPAYIFANFHAKDVLEIS